MQAAIEEASEGTPLFLKLDIDCPILDETDSALLKLWNYMIKRARVFSRGMRFNNKPLFLAPGQFIFGRIQASFDLGLSEWVIRTRIKSLIEMGLLKKVFHKDGKRGYSVYEILLKNVNKSKPKEDKSPQTQKPLIKPALSSSATTKKESIFSKKKQNNNAKEKPKYPHQPLTEHDVCHSHPLLLANDPHDSISRFGSDFLIWLLKKAKQFTNSPSNPIGLLIHMLRTGAYQGEYADIAKSRQRDLEIQAQIKANEERAKAERQAIHKKSLDLVQASQVLATRSASFRSNLIRLIDLKAPRLKPFLTHQLGKNFSSSDVLANAGALYLFSHEIEILMKNSGILIPDQSSNTEFSMPMTDT